MSMDDARGFIDNPRPAGGADRISRVLLGVNEPDGIIAGGSVPTDPAQYARLWVDVVDTARQNGYVKMAGPQLAAGGTSPPDTDHPHGQGRYWMNTFLEELDAELDRRISSGSTLNKGDYLHYLSYHVYEPNCQLDANFLIEWQLRFVMDVWDREFREVYNARGFKIEGYAITEIACAPWSGGADRAGQEKMAGPVLEGMLADERLRMVAWFSARSYGGDWHNGAHYLWDENTGVFSSVGEMYARSCREAPALM